MTEDFTPMNQPGATDASGEINEPSTIMDDGADNPITDVAEDDNFSKKFTALTRREKALRQREAELKRRESELTSRQPQQEPAQEEQPTDWAKLLADNPIEAFKKAGYSMEDLIHTMAEGELPKDIVKRREEESLKAKIAELESKLEGKFEEYEKTSAQKEHDKVVNSFKTELKTFIDSNADEYEMIRYNDAHDTVFGVIESHYSQTGRVLSEKEAADAVEQHFMDEALKLGNVKKLRKRFTSSDEVTEEQVSSDPFSRDTLTNSLGSTAPNTPPTKKLSREESLERAAQLLKWQ